MSAGIRIETRRIALRGAALAIIGSIAAGCSSGTQRFTDSSLFTGSTPNQRAIIKAPDYQPYPGDLGVKPAISADYGSPSDYTGSVNRTAVEPVTLSPGGIERSTLPPVAAVKQKAADAVTATRDKISALKPSTVAAKAAEKSAAASAAAKAAIKPLADPVTTGSVAATTASDAVKRGWSKAGGTQITLREGETLYNLSRRFGVPVSAIVAANGLKDASSVSAGQKIVIPTYVYSSDVPVSAPDSNPDVARAKSSRGVKDPTDKGPAKPAEGDQAAVLPATPRPRDKAADPAKAASAKTASAKASAPKAEAARIPASATKTVAGGYTVREGDSLWSIAKKTNSTTSAIKAANKLDGKPLRIGQVLVIPKATASADVDPIITGTAKADKPATKAAAKAGAPLPTYTAPKGSVAEAAAQPASAPEETGIGKMRWPARGKVVGSYGSRSGGKANDGIDIALPAGTPVKAAENGVVIYAGDGLKEFGKTVLVRHDDGLVTVYGHNGDIKVKRGDTVSRGQAIAASGMSGDTKVPMLHFEVRKDSQPVDPGKYLD